MKALVSLLISENVRSPPLFKNQNSGRFSLCSYRVVQSRVFCWTSVDHRCNLCNIPLDAATFFFLFWKICNITSIPFLLLLLSSRESILCPAGGKLTSRLQLNKSAKWRGLEDKKKEKKKKGVGMLPSENRVVHSKHGEGESNGRYKPHSRHLLDLAIGLGWLSSSTPTGLEGTWSQGSLSLSLSQKKKKRKKKKKGKKKERIFCKEEEEERDEATQQGARDPKREPKRCGTRHHGGSPPSSSFLLIFNMLNVHFFFNLYAFYCGDIYDECFVQNERKFWTSLLPMFL